MKYATEMEKIWAREDRKEMKLSYPMELDPSIWEYHKSTCNVSPDDVNHLRQRMNGMFGQTVKLVNAKTGRKFIGHIRKDRMPTDQTKRLSGRRSGNENRSRPYKMHKVRNRAGLVVTQHGTTKCRRFDYDDITRVRHNRMPDGTYRMEITYNE